MKINRRKKQRYCPYYTSAEVRLLLNIDVYTLTTLRKTGMIDFIKIGNKYLYDKIEIASIVHHGTPWFCMN